MSTSRFPAALRRLLLRLHFYAGVLIAPFLILAAVSGLLYTSSFVVEDVLYQDLRTVAETGGEPIPLSDQVRAAAQVRPQWSVTGVRPADGPKDTTGVLMDDGAVRESGGVAIVYIDPYTGEVQGDSTTYGRSHAGPFREWAATFHRTLHLGDFGRNYSELAASWLWVVVSAGLVVRLWRRRRPGRGLRPRRRSAGRARSLSWHSSLGLWLTVLLLFLSATGLTWSRYAGEHIADLREQLSWTTPTLEAAGSEQVGREHLGDASGTGPVSRLDAVYETARGAGLEGPLEVTLPQSPGGEFAVAETQRSFPVQHDQITVAADGAGTARVTAELRFADWPLTAQASSVAIALHMGLLFGLANQILLAVAMLAFLAVILLGYRMWWQRRSGDSMLGRPYPRGALRSLPWPAVAIGAPALALLGWFLPLFGIPLLAFLIADVLIGLRRRRRPGPEPSSGGGLTLRTEPGPAAASVAGDRLRPQPRPCARRADPGRRSAPAQVLIAPSETAVGPGRRMERVVAECGEDFAVPPGAAEGLLRNGPRGMAKAIARRGGRGGGSAARSGSERPRAGTALKRVRRGRSPATPGEPFVGLDVLGSRGFDDLRRYLGGGPGVGPPPGGLGPVAHELLVERRLGAARLPLRCIPEPRGV